MASSTSLTTAHFPPAPAKHGPHDEVQHMHIKVIPYFRSCTTVLTERYPGQCDGYAANPPTDMANTNVPVPFPYDRDAIGNMDLGDAAGERQDFIIQNTLLQNAMIARAGEQSSVNVAKQLFISCLWPAQHNIGKGLNNTIEATSFATIKTNLFAHYGSPPMGEIDKAEALLCTPFQPIPLDEQLCDFNNASLYYTVCTGTAMSPLQHFRFLYTKTQSGPMVAHLSSAVERHSEIHPTCGAASTATPANFIAVLRPRFNALTPELSANMSSAHSATVTYSGPLHKVVKVAQSLPSDAASLPLPTTVASTRSTSPSPGAHPSLRHSQTSKANPTRPAAKPSSTAKWCSLHNTEGHTTADCTEIAKLSPGLQRLYLSRPKPTK